jgi:hypothetical protein
VSLQVNHRRRLLYIRSPPRRCQPTRLVDRRLSLAFTRRVLPQFLRRLSRPTRGPGPRQSPQLLLRLRLRSIGHPNRHIGSTCPRLSLHLNPPRPRQ